MPFVIDEEHQLFLDSVNKFLDESAPVSAFRTLRDSKEPLGFHRELWSEMAEMGWPGMLVPESYGGLEFGFLGVVLLFEAMGRRLTSSPMLSSGVMGPVALAMSENKPLQKQLLPALAEGRHLLAFAIDEGPHHQPSRARTTVRKRGETLVLNGMKERVVDGHCAETLIVAARTSGASDDVDGLSLFAVPADVDGILRHPLRQVDYRYSCDLSFSEVSLQPEWQVGSLGEGFKILDAVLDRGRVCLAAEMLGIARAAFAMTLAYLKERKQFGVPVGTFQALQHRAAHLYCELEMTESVVAEAALAVVEKRADLPALASLAKAKAGKTVIAVTNEAVQMHGGIGMTDEFDLGFFVKRARTASQQLGCDAFHGDRFARLHGY